MPRRIAVASALLLAAVALTAIVTGSMKAQASQMPWEAYSQTSDAECVVPTAVGPEAMSWIVLEGLERPVHGVASRYVITNEADSTATTLHNYCDAGQNLVGTDDAIIDPEQGELFDLAATDAVPEGYSGYVIVYSDQLITGTVLPLDYSLGVEIGPNHSQRAAPGATVLYEHTVTNVGTITDTYLVDVLSTQDWPVALLTEGHLTPTQALTLQLGAGMAASLQVSLTLPLDAAGITEVTLVTATSLLSPTVQDTAVNTTFAAHTIYLPLTLRRWPPIPFTPHLNAIDNSDQDNYYTVTWQPADLASTYILQEATNISFSDIQVVYSGTGLSWSTASPGKTPNTYYYRVKARNAWGDSSWSNVQSVVVHPLFVGLDLRWDGMGYLRGDWYYDIGMHQTTELVKLVDADTVECHNHVWYDPNPLYLESEEWNSYYSVSTGYFKASSLPSDPSRKWDGSPGLLPYDWEFRHGEVFYIGGQPFAVTGPHSGYTVFGKAVQYWKVVNTEKFLYWDGGGDWTQYIHPGDAKLHYDAGPSRLVLHSDMRRTDYYKGARTNDTVHYIMNLTSSNAFEAAAAAPAQSSARPEKHDDHPSQLLIEGLERLEWNGYAGHEVGIQVSR